MKKIIFTLSILAICSTAKAQYSSYEFDDIKPLFYPKVEVISVSIPTYHSINVMLSKTGDTIFTTSESNVRILINDGHFIKRKKILGGTNITIDYWERGTSEKPKKIILVDEIYTYQNANTTQNYFYSKSALR